MFRSGFKIYYAFIWPWHDFSPEIIPIKTVSVEHNIHSSLKSTFCFYSCYYLRFINNYFVVFCHFRPRNNSYSSLSEPTHFSYTSPVFVYSDEHGYRENRYQYKYNSSW